MKLFARLSLAVLIFGAALPASDAENPPAICDHVRFQPLPGTEKEMVGATVAGSNVSRTDGFVTLGEVKEAPAAGEWGELKLDNTKVYRWLRFQMPPGGKGKLGTVEFYAGDRLIAGGDRKKGGEKGIKYAFFLPGAQDDRSVGYDIVDAATASRVSIQPANADPAGPVDVKLGSTKGAIIRYTTDGTWPTMQNGLTYSAPIHIDKTTTFSAEAFLPDRAPSLLNTTSYLLPGSSKPGLTAADLGNSLTGTTGGFWRYARTAGYNHKSNPFLRPGALTRELWALVSGDYKNDKVANSKEEQAAKRGSASWADYWSKIGKVDLLTLQPRDFDLDKEIGAEVNFIKLFRQKSPDLQPWLYCEWVEMARKRPSDQGVVPSYEMKKTFPALTWEESMGAMLLYVEELQHRLAAAYPEGKPAHIIPSALAMGWIRNMIDHGKFGSAKPGSFYPLLFNDQVHPADAAIHGTANGGYLVDMTWFSALYREPPEGKVLPIETTFTPEQVHLVNQLAWNVIENYPDCGLYKQGTDLCGKPEFNNDGKIITLQSSTPGAWFRYTLDGTEPTRTRGYVYCGAISVQPGIQVKALAYKSGMADSTVTALTP
jgi:hypothetical protein